MTAGAVGAVHRLGARPRRPPHDRGAHARRLDARRRPIARRAFGYLIDPRRVRGAAVPVAGRARRSSSSAERALARTGDRRSAAADGRAAAASRSSSSRFSSGFRRSSSVRAARLVTLFRVDILNVMGPSIVAAGLVWGVCGRAPAAASRSARSLATAVAMVTPLVRIGGVGGRACRSGCSGTSGRRASTRPSRCFPGPGSCLPGAAVRRRSWPAPATREPERRLHGRPAPWPARLWWRWASTRPRCRPSTRSRRSGPARRPTSRSASGVMMLALACRLRARARLAPLGVTVAGSWSVSAGARCSSTGFTSSSSTATLTWPLRRRLPLWRPLVGLCASSALLMYGAVVLRDRFADRRLADQRRQSSRTAQ